VKAVDGDLIAPQELYGKLTEGTLFRTLRRSACTRTFGVETQASLATRYLYVVIILYLLTLLPGLAHIRREAQNPRQRVWPSVESLHSRLAVPFGAEYPPEAWPCRT
jgi:hypothetical protein